MISEETRKMAIKVILTAIKRDASVGEGVDVLVIDKNGLGEIKEEPLEQEKSKKK